MYHFTCCKINPCSLKNRHQYQKFVKVGLRFDYEEDASFVYLEVHCEQKVDLNTQLVFFSHCCLCTLHLQKVCPLRS